MDILEDLLVLVRMLRFSGGKTEILRPRSKNSDLTLHGMIFTATERDFSVRVKRKKTEDKRPINVIEETFMRFEIGKENDIPY